MGKKKVTIIVEDVDEKDARRREPGPGEPGFKGYEEQMIPASSGRGDSWAPGAMCSGGWASCPTSAPHAAHWID